MSKKPPKLDTKYENDDPEYTSGTSSKSAINPRSQPERKAKKSLFESFSDLFGNSSKSVVQELSLESSEDEISSPLDQTISQHDTEESDATLESIYDEQE